MLKTYLGVIRITLKEQTAYRMNTILGACMSIFRILLAFLLWRIIFDSRAQVAGYTFPMMFTYYMLVALFLRLDQSDSMVWEIGAEIKNGQFNKYVVRPVHPLGYFFARSFGKSLYALAMNLLAFACWALLFRQHLVFPSSLDRLLLVGFIFILGTALMTQIKYMITMLTFKTVEIAGLYYMTRNIMDILSGAMVPLSLLPGGIQAIIQFTPFYYVLYYPAALYLGKHVLPVSTAVTVLAGWNVLTMVINLTGYTVLFRHYEGVGA